jgi:recombination protein RecA
VSKKRKRLAAAVAVIQQRWGQRALRRGPTPAPVQRAIPTGFAGLDSILDGSGGIPRGRISELLGAPTSGMVTLALKVMAQAQANGDMVAYIDLGHTFDPDYAAAVGLFPTNFCWPGPIAVKRRWRWFTSCCWATALG